MGKISSLQKSCININFSFQTESLSINELIPSLLCPFFVDLSDYEKKKKNSLEMIAYLNN